MKNYNEFLNGNYKERKDFHCGVKTGEIVKLDKDYIKNLDNITTLRSIRITDEQLNKEYVLVNFDTNYGYALRNMGTDKLDFLGWVPPEYIRHLNDEEINAKKYNI